MNFKPLHDNILIRRIDPMSTTSGGIIIPDTVKEKPQEGEVLAVGTGVHDKQGNHKPLRVNIGDRVLFGKWSGTDIKINNEILLIMKEDELLGIIR